MKKNKISLVFVFYLMVSINSCLSQDRKWESKKDIERAEYLIKNNLSNIEAGDKSETFLKALNYLDKALELDSLNIRAYNDKITVLQELKKNKDIILTLSKLLKIQPDFAEGYTVLGMTYEKLNKKDSAKLSYKNAILSYLKKPETDQRNSNLILLEYLLTKNKTESLNKLRQFPIKDTEIRKETEMEIEELDIHQ